MIKQKANLVLTTKQKPASKHSRSSRDHAIATQNEIATKKTSSPTSSNSANPINSVAGTMGTTLVFAGLIGLVFAWAYWPVMVDLVDQWTRIADYSHGFLVVPIAIGMLWVRWSDKPASLSWNHKANWLGLGLVACAAGMQWVAATYYFESIAGWSIPIWIAGIVLLLFGHRILVWALPPIIFLLFMVPLPYGIETAVARPLQNTSAQVSCFILQCCLQPAALEGNTILLGHHSLEVARACSGLRITLGIAALAFAFIVVFRRSIWHAILVSSAILPIAIFSNSIRIVVTGFIYQAGFEDVALMIGHDLAGLFVLPLAAGLFFLLLRYLDRLLPNCNGFDSINMVKRQVTEA